MYWTVFSLFGQTFQLPAPIDDNGEFTRLVHFGNLASFKRLNICKKICSDVHSNTLCSLLYQKYIRKTVTILTNSIEWVIILKTIVNGNSFRLWCQFEFLFICLLFYMFLLFVLLLQGYTKFTKMLYINNRNNSSEIEINFSIRKS